MYVYTSLATMTKSGGKEYNITKIKVAILESFINGYVMWVARGLCTWKSLESAVAMLYIDLKTRKATIDLN